MNEFSVFVLNFEPDSPFVYLLLELFVVWNCTSFVGALNFQCFWKSLEVYLISRETQNWKIPDGRIAFRKKEDIPIFYKSLDPPRIITNDFLLFFMNSIHSFIHQIFNNCLNYKTIEWASLMRVHFLCGKYT